MVRRPAAGRWTPRHARFARLKTATGTTAATAASTFTTTTGPAAVDTTRRRGRRWPVLGAAGTRVARSG